MTKRQLVGLLADLLFAYVNKDEEMPHQFEFDAVIGACELLSREYDLGKYTDHFFNSVLKDMKETRDKFLS